MGRNARKEAIVKLREQIAACQDDPKLLISLSRQLNKLLPKKKAVMGRPRTTPSPDVSPKSTYIRNGSAMDDMPLREQTLNRLVLACEAEDRRRGRLGLPKTTEAERKTLIDDLAKTFSEVERAVLGAEAPNAQE